MRIMIAALLCLSVTTAPASATTPAPDPVTAIQRQLVKGHGVKIVVGGSSREGAGGWSRYKPEKGLVEFGTGKIVATDLLDYNTYHPPSHDICIKGRAYERVREYRMPPGKTWVTFKMSCMRHLAVGFILLTQPETLKAVLATATDPRPGGTYDGTRTTLYEGTITLAELHTAYPAMGALGKDAGRVVAWKLWVGEDQLVRRAWSSVTLSPPKKTADFGDMDIIDDLQVSGWGMRVKIKRPPTSKTTTMKHVDSSHVI